MIPELGHLALILALAMALVQSLWPIYGIAANRPAYRQVAAPAAFGQCFMLERPGGIEDHPLRGIDQQRGMTALAGAVRDHRDQLQLRLAGHRIGRAGDLGLGRGGGGAGMGPWRG